MKALHSMQQNEQFCDLVLQTREGSVSAHKCVLCAGSSYFKTMLSRTDFREARLGTVVLEDVSLDILRHVVSHIYCCNITVQPTDLLPLLVAADRFRVFSLYKKCCKLLKASISVCNVLSVREYAKLYQCKELHSLCTDFIMKNFKGVSESDNFTSLPHDVLVDIISQDNLRVSCEEQVYEAIIRWIYHDVECRKHFFKT